MTLAVQNYRVLYNANGSTDTFAIPQSFFSDDDNIVVVVRDPADSPPSEDEQTDGVDYSIVGTDVVFNAAPASGLVVGIFRNLEIKQVLDMIDSGTFSVQSLETQLDKIVAMLQQLDGMLARCIKVKKTAPASELDMDIEELFVADSILVVNSTNDGIAMGPTVAEIEEWKDDAEAAAAAAAASADDADDSETAAAASATSAASSAAAAASSAAAAAASAASVGVPKQEVLNGVYAASDTTFTLSQTPTADAVVMVLLSGIPQEQGVDYTISGAAITFTGIDVSAEDLFAFYRY